MKLLEQLQNQFYRADTNTLMLIIGVNGQGWLATHDYDSATGKFRRETQYNPGSFVRANYEIVSPLTLVHSDGEAFDTTDLQKAARSLLSRRSLSTVCEASTL